MNSGNTLERSGTATAYGVAEVDWSVEASRRGAATMKLGGRFVHSRYDPEREAETTARGICEELTRSRSSVLILMGSGLGYIVRAIAAALAATPAKSILVYEPFPEISEAVSRLGHSIASHDFVEVVHTSDELDRALDGLGSRELRSHLTVHPGYEHVARYEVRRVLERLRRRRGSGARRSFDEIDITLRDLRVLRRLTFRPTVDSLAGTLTGQTAIIASGGPSLDEAIPVLTAHRGGVIFACPQALERLHRAGVRAHYVVSPDPQDLFALSGAPEDAPFDTLLLDTQSHPGMAKRFLERVTHFHLRAPSLASLAWRAMGIEEIDEPFITVSETAWWLARSMGARRFVFAGVDFDSDDPRYRDRFQTRNQAGQIVATNSHYFHGARYLDDACARASEEGSEFFRVGAGLPIRGCQTIDEAELANVLRPLPYCETPASPFCMVPERLALLRKLVRDLERETRTNPNAFSQAAAPASENTPPDLVPLSISALQDECAALRAWLDVRIERFEVARRKSNPDFSRSSPRA